MRIKTILILSMMIVSLFAVSGLVDAVAVDQRSCEIGQANDGDFEACMYFQPSGSNSRGTGQSRGKKVGQNDSGSVSMIMNTSRLTQSADDADQECGDAVNLVNGYTRESVTYDVRADPSNYSDYCIASWSQWTNTSSLFNVEKNSSKGFFTLRSGDFGMLDGLFFSSVLQETSYIDFNLINGGSIMQFDLTIGDSDEDNDGLPNGWETFASEGLTKNGYPVPVDTKSDTDGDGLGDYAEVVTYQSNPQNPDDDFDGLTDLEDYQGNGGIGPCGRGVDYDVDTLTDWFEEHIAGGNCQSSDTDGDMVPDDIDFMVCDIADEDADGDGFTDFCELNVCGSNCADYWSQPDPFCICP